MRIPARILLTPPSCASVFDSPPAHHTSLALQPEPHPRLGWPPLSPKHHLLEPRPKSPFSLMVQPATTTPRPIFSLCVHAPTT